MEENFNPVAQTRANYYTPGSPVYKYYFGILLLFEI